MNVLRRLPVLPTLVVVLAAAIMVALGIWQLGRADEKEALLARYGQAQAMSADVPWPASEVEATRNLYRHTTITCTRVTGVEPRGGRNAQGAPGWVHVASCVLPDGAVAPVVLGWSRDSAAVPYYGGEVMGFIAPGPRLIAMPAQAGLGELAPPDPADLPNNHLAYAGQWFLFALTALVIYGFAVRRRLKPASPA